MMKLSMFSLTPSRLPRSHVSSSVSGSAFVSLAASVVVAVAASACAGTEDEKTAEVAQGATWVGKTYLMQVPHTHWSVPRGVGSEIGPFVPFFLIRIDSATGNQVEATIGTALDALTQDMCTPTAKFTGSSAAFPMVTLGPAPMPVFLRNANGGVAVNTTIQNLTFENLLPDGVTLPDDMEGYVRAVMDFREAAPMFTLLPDPTPDNACMALQEALMVPCEVCPQDATATYCLSLVADGVGAVEYTGTPMVDVVAAARGAECMDDVVSP
jgi:hypothetical protein